MNEQELRAIVRDAVARHLSSSAIPAAASLPRVPQRATTGVATHPSHALYLTVINADESCVIEPSVACDHCGYCKSHGH
jgi:hypothetical protein